MRVGSELLGLTRGCREHHCAHPDSAPRFARTACSALHRYVVCECRDKVPGLVAATTKMLGVSGWDRWCTSGMRVSEGLVDYHVWNLAQCAKCAGL
jgi:hypothetical protein